MTAVAAAAATVAASQTKSPDGALGLLVFLVLAVVVYFLFRSMARHLRKAQRMRDEEAAAHASEKTTPQRDQRR